MRCMILFSFMVFSTLNVWSKSYYISPTNGSDLNDGNEKTPFKTINKAIEILKDGDVVFLMAGNYFETILLRKKQNIIFKAYGDGEAILYGSYLDFIDNESYPWKLLRKETNNNWNNTQYIYVAQLPKDGRRPKKSDFQDQINFIFDKYGKQLFGYRKKENFKKRNRQNTDGEGYWFSADSIYVAVNDPYDDRYTTLYISKTGATIRNSGCKGIIFDGGEQKQLKIKYSSRYAYAGEGDIGGSKILNVQFEDCHRGAYLLGVRGEDFEFRNCSFTYKTDPKLVWKDIKATLLESVGIVYARGELQNLIIKNSHFDGVFNGVVALPGNTEISNNFFYNIGDDAVELDGDAVNSKVFDNYFINCFVALSLCPVEIGPVYIYNNVIYSQVEKYRYEILKNGETRFALPRVLKFWNLPDGEKLLNGKKYKISQNVHFYYNTVISNDRPLSIGIYTNDKSYAPMNSSVYNNIFYSNGLLAYSTGYAEDGIDIDNNLFYSTTINLDRRDTYIFVGWNGSKKTRNLQNNSQWTNNVYKKIEFENLDLITQKPDSEPYKLCKKSIQDLENKFELKRLPSHFPSANTLNKRKYPGNKIRMIK